MTREHAKQLLPIITAYAEGKDIEYYYEGKWGSDVSLSFCDDVNKYRIKPDLKRVPLTAEDVPPGSVFRANVNNTEGKALWFTPLLLVFTGVGLQGELVLSWSDLESYYEIRRPGEDWKPCWKEVAE